MKLYLDIDDTLIRWTYVEGTHGVAAPDAKSFLLWAMDNFEVHWLTYWFPDGERDEVLLGKLSVILDIPVSVLRRIPSTDFGYRNPFSPRKVDGLDPEEPWVWVEDEVLWSQNQYWLEHNGRLDDYYTCNVTRNPGALRQVRQALTRRFGLQEAA